MIVIERYLTYHNVLIYMKSEIKLEYNALNKGNLEYTTLNVDVDYSIQGNKLIIEIKSDDVDDDKVELQLYKSKYGEVKVRSIVDGSDKTASYDHTTGGFESLLSVNNNYNVLGYLKGDIKSDFNKRYNSMVNSVKDEIPNHSFDNIRFRVENRTGSLSGFNNSYRQDVLVPKNSASRIFTRSIKDYLPLHIGWSNHESLIIAPDDSDDVVDADELFDHYYYVNPNNVKERIDEIKIEKRKLQEYEELLKRIPELENLPVNDPDVIKEKMRLAEDKDEPVLLSEESDRCKDQREECNVDIINHYITSDGNIMSDRIHTY